MIRFLSRLPDITEEIFVVNWTLPNKTTECSLVFILNISNFSETLLNDSQLIGLLGFQFLRVFTVPSRTWRPHDLAASPISGNTERDTDCHHGSLKELLIWGFQHHVFKQQSFTASVYICCIRITFAKLHVWLQREYRHSFSRFFLLKDSLY